MSAFIQRNRTSLVRLINNSVRLINVNNKFHTTTQLLFKSISSSGYKQQQPKYDIYVDVREDDEWNEGHIKNAKHIKLGDILAIKDKSNNIINQLNNQKCLVYCKAGRRSATASDVLEKYNIDCTSLSDGIIGWSNNKLPIEK